MEKDFYSTEWMEAKTGGTDLLSSGGTAPPQFHGGLMAPDPKQALLIFPAWALLKSRTKTSRFDRAFSDLSV